MPTFGQGGRIDLRQGLRRRGPLRQVSGVTSPPIVCRDVVVVGASIVDYPPREMPPGDIRGFDVRIGEQRWVFHSVPYRTATGRVFQIPYMAGGGGNLVVLLPNGLSAFRFGAGEDYEVYDMDPLVLAGEAIHPFPCPSGPEETSPEVRQPLTASELRLEFPEHTFYAGRGHRFPFDDSGPLNLFLAADGMHYGASKDGFDVGTWHITPDSHFCYTWHVWDSRRERCFAVYREGETFELYSKDRLDKGVFSRVPGNPEGY